MVFNIFTTLYSQLLSLSLFLSQCTATYILCRTFGTLTVIKRVDSSAGSVRRVIHCGKLTVKIFKFILVVGSQLHEWGKGERGYTSDEREPTTLTGKRGAGATSGHPGNDVSRTAVQHVNTQA